VVEDACLREAGSGGGASGEDTGCSTMPISACHSYPTAVSRRVLLTLCQSGRLQVHDAFVSVTAVLSTNRIHLCLLCTAWSVHRWVAVCKATVFQVEAGEGLIYIKSTALTNQPQLRQPTSVAVALHPE